MTRALVWLSRRTESRHLLVLLIFVGVSVFLFGPTNNLNASDLVIRGEKPAEKDIADLRVLAAQVLPANAPPGVIECSGNRAEVYGAPVEQTSRLWRGYYFGCEREARYTRREDGRAAVGSWIAWNYPIWSYAVIVPRGETLSSFSSEAAGSFHPIHVTRDLASEDIVAAYDAIGTAPPMAYKGFGESNQVEQVAVSRLPIKSMEMRGPSEIKVDLNHGDYKGWDGFWLTLRKEGAAWRITDISGFVH